MKNVLLVIPRYRTYGFDGHYVMPMGTLYVSAYLKRSKAANVFTLNLNHREGEEYDILADMINTNNIDIIGIGGLSGEYQDLARMARYARAIKPDITVMLGGGIVTADPETAMEAVPEADFGMIGEGEITIVELINTLTHGGNPANVCGLIFRNESGAFIKTEARKEINDLDSLPFPDYEGFDYGEYLKNNPDMSDEGKRYSQVSVIGGRSCKFNCTFCFHPSGSRYRQRSLDSIFEEIDWLTNHYEISYIALREELFATDNERVREFCRRVEKYDFDWSIQLRIDNVNQELVDLLKNTRCRYLFVGVESAVDEILRSMHKGITVKQIENALEMLHIAGLNSRSGVIMGDTLETSQTAEATIQWFMKYHERYRMFIDMIIAFPCSTLYKRACRDG
ncbi:MAG: B12-binding domain-containing radical SAM protein, partial [Lactobacillus sp.]|nr:B12-binding domain-containing radical SAM protein [Lactobacillus sp.]